jgi:Pvc16 N-terminal domain
MARFGAIAAVGESVVRYLKGQFALFPGSPNVEQVTTRTFSDPGAANTFNSASGSLTLLLYRVDLDGHPRNPTILRGPIPPGTNPTKTHGIPLDLRYLVTAWADTADTQQLILGNALAALDAHPTFGAGDLVESMGGVDAIWGAGESFQFIPDEMGTEDLYQIWESLGHHFELSVPYKARVVRLEHQAVPAGMGIVLEKDLVIGRGES